NVLQDLNILVDFRGGLPLRRLGLRAQAHGQSKHSGRRNQRRIEEFVNSHIESLQNILHYILPELKFVNLGRRVASPSAAASSGSPILRELRFSGQFSMLPRNHYS